MRECLELCVGGGREWGEFSFHDFLGAAGFPGASGFLGRKALVGHRAAAG